MSTRRNKVTITIGVDMNGKQHSKSAYMTIVSSMYWYNSYLFIRYVVPTLKHFKVPSLHKVVTLDIDTPNIIHLTFKLITILFIM